MSQTRRKIFQCVVDPQRQLDIGNYACAVPFSVRLALKKFSRSVCAECRAQSEECRVQSAECRVQSAEYRVQSAECRVQSAERRVQREFVGADSISARM